MTTKLERLPYAKGSKPGRHYQTPAGVYPSVTNILDAAPKDALIRWAAKEERAHVVEVAERAFEEWEVYRERCRQAIPIDDVQAQGALEAFPPVKWFREYLIELCGVDLAHERKRDRAADIGQAVHAYAEWRFRLDMGLPTGTPPLLDTDEAKRSVEALNAWRKQVSLRPKLMPKATELSVWSDTLRTAGTFDLWADITADAAGMVDSQSSLFPEHGDRVDVIYDWKTSKGIYWNQLVQGATYRHCMIERGLITERSLAAVVRLPKGEGDVFDPARDVHYILPDECKELVIDFRALRRVWESRPTFWGQK